MKLTPEQIRILSEWKIEWNKFYLQWQLDRKQYTSINEVLETIGLKWNRKEKAHIFDGEMLEEAIQDIIESGECETLKETIKKFQFFPTPREVAEYLVELAELKETDTVLEPSAWEWHIAECIKMPLLTTVELDFSKCEILVKKWFTPINCDFLQFKWEWWDKIIMNPPFSKSQDVKHILHAYNMLEKWWILVSVASASITTRSGSLYDELRSLNPEIIQLPEWSFKESGTMVNTVIIKLTK
mgnify:CR=1 FL=1